MGRVVIATAEFAPIPPFHLPVYPGGVKSDGHRSAFSRHDGIYRSDVVQNQKPTPGTGTVPPPVGRPRAQVKERAGRITPFSSSAMSSGRLFLDRVGRHQSPSPLHRRDQNNSVARSERTIYHRTVTSVLTGCPTFRDRRNFLLDASQPPDRIRFISKDIPALDSPGTRETSGTPRCSQSLVAQGGHC